jgi:hypothetical protein
MARPADVLAAVAKANATLAETRKARELAAHPRVAETVTTHTAVCRALAKFRPEQLHPALDEARAIRMNYHASKAIEQMVAIKSELAHMRKVMPHLDKALRLTREVQANDRPRVCEARHRGVRPGRAPRRSSNSRRRGSARASGPRTGQDPGDPDPESDSSRLSPLLVGGAGR